MPHNRRNFLKTAAAVLPWSGDARGPEPRSAAGELGVLAVGVGWRGLGIAHAAASYGRLIAVCDVNLEHAERAAKSCEDSGRPRPRIYRDYREALQDKSVDIVTIGTPDHWHVPILLASMRAGKDVYCEKPMTLTVDEGKRVCRAVRATGRIVQVGTQQRTEFARNFLAAVAIVRSGRLGRKVTTVCSIGHGETGGPFPVSDPPPTLDWDMWLGPAPKVPYTPKRADFNFRYFLDYSGGHITDWGAHHIDIAQWALGLDATGPSEIEAEGDLPLGRRATYDLITGRNRDVPNIFNASSRFRIVLRYASGATIIVVTDEPNGIEFIGERGRLFVTREKLSGPAVREIEGNDRLLAWLCEEIVNVYGGRIPTTHMKNFIDCVGQRRQPVSDVFSHHRAASACHLGNAALMVGRKLQWDPDKEEFIGDSEAAALLRREPRRGYSSEG